MSVDGDAMLPRLYAVQSHLSLVASRLRIYSESVATHAVLYGQAAVDVEQGLRAFESLARSIDAQGIELASIRHRASILLP